MTVNSRIINTFLRWSPHALDVPLSTGARIQIMPSLADLPRARKPQFAAVIASEGLLVVWDDDVDNIVRRAEEIEQELIELVWAAGEETESVDEIAKEKNAAYVTTAEVDEESGQARPQERPTHLLNTILVGLTLIVVITMLGAGMRSVMTEVLTDGNYLRLAFILLTPIQIFFTLVSLEHWIASLRASWQSGLSRHSSSPRSWLAAWRSASGPSNKCK